MKLYFMLMKFDAGVLLSWLSDVGGQTPTSGGFCQKQEDINLRIGFLQIDKKKIQKHLHHVGFSHVAENNIFISVITFIYNFQTFIYNFHQPTLINCLV